VGSLVQYGFIVLLQNTLSYAAKFTAVSYKIKMSRTLNHLSMNLCNA